MANMYRIPPSTNEEEKAIGGVLTFIQFFWLLGFGALGLMTSVGMYLMTSSIFLSILPALIIGSIGLPFAFYKKKDMTFCTYLRRKHLFKKKSKILVNRRYFK